MRRRERPTEIALTAPLWPESETLFTWSASFSCWANRADASSDAVSDSGKTLAPRITAVVAGGIGMDRNEQVCTKPPGDLGAFLKHGNVSSLRVRATRIPPSLSNRSRRASAAQHHTLFLQPRAACARIVPPCPASITTRGWPRPAVLRSREA